MRWLGLALAVAVADLVLATSFAGWAEHRYGGVVETTDPLPAVLFWADDATLGDASRRSLNHALRLYRQGRVSAFVSVGGHRPAAGFHGAMVLDRLLAEAGVPARLRHTGRGSNDTVTNLLEARHVARTQGWERLLLVSDPLHVMRMERALAEHLQPVTGVPAAYSYAAATPPLSAPALWLRVHHEWAAYLAYGLPDAVYRGLVDGVRE